ncbi:FAD-dependent monooxygenase [Paractinoplanes durhamensis]|uniref:Monooxygenase n=1 Tax=Paractinoplanes durhamensis TaxID=113563 RepID=A0ABQ3YX20_9ACTN|nr:FAD-dependent monooxygenase [Actinoplanes durhamensis]GIE02134.1 monooxygenase [Actinoplanes durhamensis]
MRVLISGAGIAGPALAHWLHRAGADVTVVEKAPEPRPGGHAVDVRGVAKDVVEKMGIREAIRARQIDDRGFAMVDERGRRILEMPADMFGGEGIVAEIEIARGDLATILYDATAARVDYRFGDRIVAIDGADVTFASGGTERFDVIAGADGVRSGVRKIAFGPHEDYVRPLGGYASYFTVPDPGDLGNWSAMFNTTGGRAVLVRPEAGGTAKASLSFRSPAFYDRIGRDEQIRVLTERFTGVGWRVPALLAELPAANDLYFDEVSQVHVATWARGRVVLLGDAGYCGSPLAGMGTSMSLVGAYVLGGELASARTPEEAFAAYQERMAGYVAQGTQLPPGGMAMAAPKSRLMIRARAMSMRMMFRWPMKQVLAKQFSKADAITLSDYAPSPAHFR